MITNNSLGNPLGNSFIFSHLYRQVLREENGPVEQIIFARKIKTGDDRFDWVRRDISDIFVNATPIVKSIASNYGTSSGAEVELVFDNTPIPVLRSLLRVKGRISRFLIQKDKQFTFRVGDWIQISDYENIEYRRIQNIIEDGMFTQILINASLDHDYDINSTEIRFVFARTLSVQNRLETPDFYNGWIQMNLGFADSGEYMTIFQGEIVGGAIDPNNTVTLTAQDKVKSLVETQLTARFEVDDRGVASVPTACGYNGEETKKPVSTQIFGSEANDDNTVIDGPNIGNGEISDVNYSDDKFNEINIDQVWSFTYRKSANTFHAWGSRVIPGQGDSARGGITTGQGRSIRDRFESTGTVGEQAWTIDASDIYGWSVTITEGDLPFEHGDQFVMFTHKPVDGRVYVVPGRGFAESPILEYDERYLNPSYVVESLLKDVLLLTHENISLPNPPENDLLTNLDAIRQLDVDFRTELRGIFTEGTSAIQVIDDALRCVNGWMYSTHDDHLSLFYYSPFSFGDYDNFDIVADFDSHRSSSRYPNAANPQVQPRMVDSIKNQVVFSHAKGSVFIEDTDSQENFGRFKLDVRGEDLITHQISTGFEISDDTARNASYRALQRYKNPIFRGSVTGIPSTLLLEIGDIPMMFAREVQFVNKPFWVTGIEVDFTALTVTITGELATQIEGKYGIAHPDNDTQAIDLWDNTGFIGDVGEERLAFLADDDAQLDNIRWPFDFSYQAREGIPDRWGNYVEDAFIVS